ncbi:hypothetical protein L208DRAFT_680314 [Tricholoma matsutake]|nr:hypothetical protein L208DRAFT_680314 [Tricholoma matsutake 945]
MQLPKSHLISPGEWFFFFSFTFHFLSSSFLCLFYFYFTNDVIFRTEALLKCSGITVAPPK